MAYLVLGLIFVGLIAATILTGFFLAGPREKLAPPQHNEIEAMNRRLKRQGLDPKKAWKHGEPGAGEEA